MVDASHANSGKDHVRQAEVVAEIADQVSEGDPISGVMIESNLVEGAQSFTPGVDNPAELEYGKSITDACINIDTTEMCFEALAEAVEKRQS